jgi:hypothetical protein
MAGKMEEFTAELMDLFESYLAAKKQGARIVQQVLTMSEIYAKYGFPEDEFFSRIHTDFSAMSVIYEDWEPWKMETFNVVEPIIAKYLPATPIKPARKKQSGKSPASSKSVRPL